jgi:hypothetical protein
MKNLESFFIKVGLSIVLCSWLIYTTYWFVKQFTGWWSRAPILDLFATTLGTVGLGLRVAAALAAIFALISFLEQKAISTVLKLVRFALVLEAFYFMTFIVNAVFGFPAAFGLLAWHTLIEGGLWFIIETAIPTLVESIIMPASLLKLRSELTPSATPNGGITKWACIAGVSYLIVFWLTYVTQWIATIIQPKSYASLYPGYGIEYVLKHPLNMFIFILTSVGLLLLAIFFWWSSLPAMRDPEAGLNLRRVGITLTLLGGYFITIIAIFMIFGTVGGSSIWIMFFMFNNPDLWYITLPVLGISLILTRNSFAHRK